MTDSSTDLAGHKVLILATDRFEESELFGPRDALLQARATVDLASIRRDPIQATILDDPGRTITPDLLLDEVDTATYAALLLPGGIGNPDRLRMEARAIAIIRDFMSSGKPVAAICHAPWLLAEADVLAGRTITSWPSIRTDLRNAGAQVIDRAVVIDGNLITSRQPEDVPAFSAALIAAVGAST